MRKARFLAVCTVMLASLMLRSPVYADTCQQVGDPVCGFLSCANCSANVIVFYCNGTFRFVRAGCCICV